MKIQHKTGLLAGLIASTLLAACGGGGSSDNNTSTSTGTTTGTSNVITISTLHAFNSANADAIKPGTPLILGSDGNFYGVSYQGGAYNLGALYKITPGGTETILYSFGTSSTDGSQPGSIIQAGDGNFYGVTATGGANGTTSCGTSTSCVNGYGTVYRVTPAGVETVLYSFGGSSGDGIEPNDLIEGSDGNFYGTTNAGGSDSDGSVFKITTSGIETVLYSFGANSASDAKTPDAGLVQASNGMLYGTTGLGGTSGEGAVYQITTGGTEAVLHSFGSVTGDGITPYAKLIIGTDGNLYGTTILGGTYGYGSVFKVTPIGTESILASFGSTNTDGTLPYGRLLQGSDGNFYGTTFSGGINGTTLCLTATTTCYPGYGTVFEVTSAGAESILYSFDSSATDGIYPASGLIQTNGIFYGLTTGGGTYSDGTLFSFTH